MADTELYCKHCEKTTGHTYLGNRRCVCAICGEPTQVKSDRKIIAGIEKRKVESEASLSRMNGLVIQSPAIEPERDVKINRKGEIVMKKVKLTEQQRDEIIRRSAAGEKDVDLAKEFGIKQQRVWYIKQIAKRHKGTPVSPPAGASEPASGFRDSLIKIVDERINVRLGGLGLDSLEGKIRAVCAELLK